MPRPLSLATVVEKNRVASDVAFIVMAEVDVIDETTGNLDETLYFARNNEDVVYRGNTYVKSHFDFNISESAEGVPDISIGFRDPTREVIRKIDQYSGGTGWVVRLMMIATDDMTRAPEVEELVYVMGTSISGYQIDFRLGARNPLSMRFPARMQWRDRCQWAYKSKECGYDGALATCDYTLQGDNGCAAHNNTLRFGGFPGIRNRT